MPKQKITKEMVVQTAFEIARWEGMEQVLVKHIAERLGCSVQPIYSYCDHMDGLKEDVLVKVNAFVHTFILEHLDQQDLFRSMGRAYIQFAKEEPHLFKIFILQKRTGISSLDALYEKETNPEVAKHIANILHIDVKQAKHLHLHMLIYTMGIGTIFAMSKPGIEIDEIYNMQQEAYEAFLHDMKSNVEKE